MRILISGASGFIGSTLADKLTSSGHRVIRLTRRPVSRGQDAVQWDPESGRLEPADLDGVEAVVHLAGEGIGDHRWTEGHKARVLDSRVRGTNLLAVTIAGLESPPKVMVSQSGAHYYGFESGERILTEDDPPGGGFLARVVEQWEAATEPAEKAGIRVVRTRSGVVLSPDGGALQRQLLPFKLGIGGKLGSGRQYLSWISLADEVAAMEFLLERDDISGPVNLVSPNPVTNAEFTRALGDALGRPTFMPVPSVAIKLMFSTEMAEEMIFGGQRLRPKRLQDAGFEFRDPEAEAALRRMLG
ncbi:TIGR01777 family oxidoreductase [soil metagenome]